MKCQLCLTNEANQLNSHLIPDFILQSMLASGDHTSRSEKTVNFSFTPKGSSMHIGRGMTDDDINMLLGRSIDDEEIASQINHYTRDNILCTGCEKRISYIESLFNEKFYKKLDSLTDTKYQIFDESADIFKLFWISIVWRCASNSFQHIEIPNVKLEELRHCLNQSLGYSIKETIELASKNHNTIKNETMGVFYFSEMMHPTAAKVRMEYRYAEPYIFILNEFYLVYFLNGKPLTITLIGVSEEPEVNDYIIFQNDPVKIGIWKIDQFKKLSDHYASEIAKEHVDFVVNHFATAFFETIGHLPDEETTSKFLQIYTSDEVFTEFEKYTPQALDIAIGETIKLFLQ